MSLDTAALPATYASPAADPATGAPCRNCDAPLGGRFCVECGQRADVERLTVGHLVSEFAAQFLSLDRGLWYTALAVARDPGGVSRRYLDGRRRQYVGPIGFLSFAAAVALLALQLVTVGDLERLRAQMRPLATGPHALLSVAQADAYARVMYQFGQQELLVSLALAVPFAFVARWLFRRRGVNLAEVSVLTLYAFADACLLYTALIPLIWLVGGGERWRELGTFLTYVVVVVQAAWGFFGRGIGTALRALLALALGFGMLTLLLDGGAAIYVLMTVPR